MGAITDVVKRYVPASYRAMIGASGITDYYNITQLQDIANYVQARLFSTVPGADNEATVWSVQQRELLGMITTLQFIPVAVEYWGDQLISESTTGSNENVTWPDRRTDLWKIFAALQKDVNQLSIDLGVPFGLTRSVTPSVSYGDNGRGILITPDPNCFPGQGNRHSPGTELIWSNWGSGS